MVIVEPKSIKSKGEYLEVITRDLGRNEICTEKFYPNNFIVATTTDLDNKFVEEELIYTVKNSKGEVSQVSYTKMNIRGEIGFGKMEIEYPETADPILLINEKEYEEFNRIHIKENEGLVIDDTITDELLSNIDTGLKYRDVNDIHLKVTEAMYGISSEDVGFESQTFDY